MSVQSRLNVSVGIGVGLATLAGLALWWKIKYTEKIPTKWRRVGELSDLICFPLKSGGAIRTQEMDCNILGLQKGRLRDRVFMVISMEGQFVTGRTHPKMVLVQPKITDDALILSAPGMIDVEVDIARLHTLAPIKAAVWGQTVDAVDCGEEAAKWLSRFLLSEDTGLRLVYYPNSYTQREVRPKNQMFKDLTKTDSGALHDSTSFNLINESSIVELNARLSRSPVTPQQFRPNFVVKGPEAFDEDTWKWIKIGETAIFRHLKPCTRCIFTNVDPETGDRDQNHQPLKTLKSYRLFPNIPGDSPVMGINVGCKIDGKVKLGDQIYVGEE